MTVENSNFEKDNSQNNIAKSLEDSLKNAHEDWVVDENEMKQMMENYNKSKEEIILTFNWILKNEIEKTYLLKYPQIAQDVKDFLSDIFSDKSEWSMSIFNQKEFSQLDKQVGLSEHESKQFTMKLDKAIKRMELLWSYQSFKETHNESTDASLWWSNKDKFLAARLDMNSFYVPWKWKISVTKEIFNSIGDELSDWSNISKEELHTMREKQFDITSLDRMKDFVLLLWVEVWEWLQDIVTLLLNIWAWVVLAPRYIQNKLEIEWEIDTKEEAEKIIENERLLEQNPSLALIELVSNGGEIIKELAKKMVSWKNWDVALWVVSIVWLLAWWAWAIKLIWKWAKIAWKWTKVWKLGEKIEWWAWKIQSKLDKVDNTITTWWINKIVWKIPWWKDKVINNNVADYKTLEANWKLSKAERIEATEKLVNKELNIKEENWLQAAHEYKSEEFSNLAYKEKIWSITPEEKGQLTQIRIAKWKRLRDSWFNLAETKIILDNWLAWVFDGFKIFWKKDVKMEDISIDKLRINDNFSIFDYVMIPRSDWNMSKAQIIDNNWNGTVRVKWEQDWKTMMKDVKMEDISIDNKNNNHNSNNTNQEKRYKQQKEDSSNIDTEDWIINFYNNNAIHNKSNVKVFLEKISELSWIKTDTTINNIIRNLNSKYHEAKNPSDNAKKILTFVNESKAILEKEYQRWYRNMSISEL